MVLRALAVAAALVVSLKAAPAVAEPDAAVSSPPPPPGWTLPRGAISLTLTAELDTSAAVAARPASLAPDLAIGVTPELTLSIVHSTFATTGFRGTAGRGLCVTGEDDGCRAAYDNVGVEALHGLRRGALAVAALAGYHALSFDAGHHGAKLGVRLRYSRGRLVVATLPSVFVAVSARDDVMAPNPDRLWIPASALYAVRPGGSLGIATGLKGRLAELDQSYELALGALAQLAVSPSLTVGASWVHGKLVGGAAALRDDESGLDSRAFQLWITTTR
jgi:hypothetical protein